MRYLLTICLLAVALSGCQTAPQLPPISMRAGDRIGVLVKIPENPYHTHVGTTVFNNFEKTYPYRWSLESDVRAKVTDALTSSGFSVIDLATTGIALDDLSGLVTRTDGTWRVGEKKQAIVQQLAGQLGLKAVVLIKAAPTTVLMQCGAFGCSFFSATGPGLFTRSFLGLNNYIAAAAFEWHVYVLDPVADAALAESVSVVLKSPGIRLSGYSPADFDHLTEADFAPVHDAIVQFAGSAGVATATVLHGQ